MEHTGSLARSTHLTEVVDGKRQVLPEINADQLFGTSNTVAIRHAGEVYVLTRTRLNKLLLTKQGVAAAIPLAVRSTSRE